MIDWIKEAFDGWSCGFALINEAFELCFALLPFIMLRTVMGSIFFVYCSFVSEKHGVVMVSGWTYWCGRRRGLQRCNDGCAVPGKATVKQKIPMKVERTQGIMKQNANRGLHVSSPAPFSVVSCSVSHKQRPAYLTVIRSMYF